MTRDQLALWVALGISVVWGLNFVAGFVLPGYQPEPYVQGAFALAAAYLFYARKSDRNGGAEDA